MTKIWVGVSETMGFRDLIVEYIDPFFGPVDEDDEPVGRFELEFGASEIRPGSFEVYEKPIEPEEEFDLAFVLARFPFPDCPPGLNAIDWAKAKSAFFVMSDNNPKLFADANVTITDVLDVKFDWE